MSLRQENALHFRTPYQLLRIPEYMRWFDSQAIGSLYRLLSSKVYRRGVGQLKFYREGASLTELAKMYDAGKLCCYATDEEIENAMLLGERRIRDIRKQLIELKLIKAEKFKDGYIYQLGYVVKSVDEDGYEIGEETEAHWIGKWFSWAAADEESEEMYAFRYYLSEKLGSDKKKEETQTELCKKFPEIGKYFSKILASSGQVKAAPVRIKPAVKPAPIEVNTKELNNYVRPEKDEGMFAEQIRSEMDARISQFKGRLQSNHYPISHISKDFRDMLAKGADRAVLSKMILSSIHENNRFLELPLFSKNLEVIHTNSVDRFSWLWFALREDVTHSTPPSNGKSKLYKEVKMAFKQILDDYSDEQVLWTLKKIAKTPSARLALVKNHFAIKKMVSDYSADFVKFKTEQVQYNAKQEAQNAASVVDEEKRREYLKKVADSVVVASVKNKKEDTIEYWEDLMKNETNSALIQLYVGKIDDIKRRLT